MVSLLTVSSMLLLMVASGGASGGSPECGDFHRPRPGIATNKKTNRYSSNLYLYASYGEYITLFCSSSNASKLVIKDKEHQLQVEHLNSTTIQVTLNEPDVGKYIFHCTDNKINCTDSLTVYIQPAMSATAPRAHYILDEHEDSLYFIPRGEVYNVFCTGNDADSLSMKVYLCNYRHDVQTTIVNATTIAATVTAKEAGDYYCSSTSAGVRADIRIIVDYYPEARGFQCVLYYDRKLQCTWVSSSEVNRFELYLLHDQRSTLLCTGSSGEEANGCGRALDPSVSPFIFGILTLQLRSCNLVFCSNQTFIVNSDSSMKLDPAYNLKVTNISSRGVAVVWQHDYWFWQYCVYKVEYRLLGTEWRQVNASAARCHFKTVVCTCKLQLALPCPDTHYELRVYIRYNEATDIYWSDPVSIFFFTYRNPDDVDHLCVAALDESDPIASVESALWKVGTLIKESLKKKSVISGMISGMRQKLTEINKLRN